MTDASFNRMTKKIGISLRDDLYEWAVHEVEEGRAESVSALIAEGRALMGSYGDLAAQLKGLDGKVAHQIGTLGGGNHFIEVCLDTQGKVWLMLHSGSRHIGKALADHHVERAQRLKHNEALEDRDLAVVTDDLQSSAESVGAEHQRSFQGDDVDRPAVR